MFHPRLNYAEEFPEGITALTHLGAVVNRSGLESSLLELVKLRASILNGCAFCIDMHSKDALAAGETAQRLFALNAWREVPFFTDRERAALAWTDALTNVQDGHVPDEIFDEVRRQFPERELVQLTLAVTTINTWNRIAIAFRPPVGAYRPGGPKV